VSGTSLHTFVTEESDAGQRVDRFLAARLPELSRTRIQELIEAGLVLVDGAATKDARRLQAGEEIRIEAQAREPMRAEPEAIALEILYEDEDVVAVNKPAGMTVHAGAGNTRGTLVNALLGRGQALSLGGDALRPGIVHRLDKDTSGVIVVAKNDFAHAKLSEAFERREVKKTYITLVEGILKERQGRIELSIGRDPKRRTRMAAHPEKAGGAARANVRAARTDWKTLAAIDGTTLLEVRLHTGRTHQIRVHFSAMKHPVVGDTLYGAAKRLCIGRDGTEKQQPRGRAAGRETEGRQMPELGRNFLHAARLGFAQPRSGAWVEVRAPLPGELCNYLRHLASESGEDWPRIDAALSGFL
jgi:23S rRNA pseudouridine1911/1915/1917 synthase